MSAPFEVPQIGNRPNDNKAWKRAYMACERCRNTKAKCEISPDSPACVKCVRERRDCVFAAERSAKRQKKEPGTQDNHPKFKRTTSTNHRLSNATAQQEDDRPQTSGESFIDTVVSSSKDALGVLFKAAEQNDSDDSDGQKDDAAARTYDSPASAMNFASQSRPVQSSPLSSPSPTILNLWNHHRFVVQGWFSAVEAVSYIDLFFKNLSSLSPVSSSFYADHENHKSLILGEPLLCCTLLMISSRYHILPGPGGVSRADFIHMRLWKHCEHLIQKITFGQETYSNAKTRTLGSIKALLLMTEWHPKSLHFPPETDGWDSSLAPTFHEQDSSVDDASDHALPKRWLEEVFEPAKRSDRMSWMLLGLATTLAHELGVFSQSDAEDGSRQLPSENRVRTRRLLFLYVNQLSLRLGCTSFLPQTASTSLIPPSTQPHDAVVKDRDILISHWIEITKLRKTTTEMLFSSKSATRQIMSSGRYVNLLEHFRPLLAQWKQSFDTIKFTTLPPASKQMLLIDYNYVRMYINSIALQAVVERVKSRAATNVLDINFQNEDVPENKYIQEVIDASRSVLAIAVDLGDANMLQYAPVRVFIRVSSAAVFLLKAISLGSSLPELVKSLEVLEKCSHALRYKTSDDMHLSSRYGLLLDRHVRRFKRNFRTRNGKIAPPFAATGDNTVEGANSEALQQNGLQEEPYSRDVDPTPDAHTVMSDALADLNSEMDGWLAQPFDTSFAPFGIDLDQTTSGLGIDSLDFLWNIPA